MKKNLYVNFFRRASFFALTLTFMTTFGSITAQAADSFQIDNGENRGAYYAVYVLAGTVSIRSCNFYSIDSAVICGLSGIVTIASGQFSCASTTIDGCLATVSAFPFTGGTILLATGSTASVNPWLNNTAAIPAS